MSGITGFFIAVGVVASILFMLMMRADRIRDRRRAYANSSTGDTGISSGNESFGLLSWFSGSSASSSADDSCTWSSSGSSDSSCSDGGGGGDSGGGGGD